MGYDDAFETFSAKITWNSFFILLYAMEEYTGKKLKIGKCSDEKAHIEMN